MSKVDDLLLRHSGIKGMRWGHRKTGGRVKGSSDYRQTVPLRNRKPRDLSNKQLQTVNSRINLEMSYGRLNPTRIKIGQNIAKDLLVGLTTAASIYTLAHSPAGKAGAAFVKNLITKKV